MKISIYNIKCIYFSFRGYCFLTHFPIRFMSEFSIPPSLSSLKIFRSTLLL